MRPNDRSATFRHTAPLPRPPPNPHLRQAEEEKTKKDLPPSLETIYTRQVLVRRSLQDTAKHLADAAH